MEYICIVFLRERDLSAEREAYVHQSQEKDQQYNSLVKSLKDRVSLNPFRNTSIVIIMYPIYRRWFEVKQ